MGALSSERAGAVAFDIFESSMSCGGELRVSLAFYKHGINWVQVRHEHRGRGWERRKEFDRVEAVVGRNTG
jgi:hypothetical protein